MLSVAVSVAPALLRLRAQIDAQWPNRSRASDGGLPSPAHLAQSPNSDHNDGNAYDFTFDPVNGPNLDDLAVVLLADSDGRAHYTIWNRQIRNPEILDGQARAYSGTSPHTEHLHLSIYADKREDDAAWDLSDVGTGTSSSPPVDAPDTTEPAASLLLASTTTPEAGAPRRRSRVGLVVAGAGGLLLWLVLLAPRPSPRSG